MSPAIPLHEMLFPLMVTPKLASSSDDAVITIPAIADEVMQLSVIVMVLLLSDRKIPDPFAPTARSI